MRGLFSLVLNKPGDPCHYNVWNVADGSLETFQLPLCCYEVYNTFPASKIFLQPLQKYLNSWNIAEISAQTFQVLKCRFDRYYGGMIVSGKYGPSSKCPGTSNTGHFAYFGSKPIGRRKVLNKNTKKLPALMDRELFWSGRLDLN